MTGPDSPRVLLVDDSETILERAIATLSPTCAIVGAVTSGEAALEAARTLQPDVIVLDISMPGMSGLEVALRLRRDGSKVPIVFLTVYDAEEVVRAARAAGGIGYVAKPLLPSDLAVAVNEAQAGRPYTSQLQ
jgi:CheY-like chemotaxis protein